MDSGYSSWNSMFDGILSKFSNYQAPVDFIDLDGSEAGSSPTPTSSPFFRCPSSGCEFESRPSTATSFFGFPQTQCDRATSAFAKIEELDEQRVANIEPRSVSSLGSQNLHEPEPPVVVSVDDWKNWHEWGIQTAPGCPPLDQLFENKRNWRVKFNSAAPPPMQRHCVFCRSMKRPPQEFQSHMVRDASGAITCPILSIYTCPNCGEKGHTVRYCLKPQDEARLAESRQQARDKAKVHRKQTLSQSRNQRYSSNRQSLY